MALPIIEVRGLSKRYRLGAIGARTLREEFARWSARARQRAGRPPVPTRDFWALRDVSFDVRRGDVIGIIGRNGAGKSTLLRILSRITEPTEGRAVLRGRVASLLEVGTGFHPDLTGRENIFLNGAILGMSRGEIRGKFDEIVAFAEIEKFIDTPVKHYSNGMYVRLAFAVAAHLEPEILIVDEVLAVGDAAFQRKCLGKMQDMSDRNGRTVLFVSHNMQAVSALCKEAILFQGGRVADRGLSRQVIDKYLSLGSRQAAEAEWAFVSAPAGDGVKLKSIRVRNSLGQVSCDHSCGTPITVEMEFWSLKSIEVVPSFHFYNQNGVLVFPTGPLHVADMARRVYEPGLHRCVCTIPAPLLNSGTYWVHAYLGRATDGHAFVHVPEAISFQVINDGTGQGGIYTAGDWPGVIRPLLPWSAARMGDLPQS